MYGDKDRIYESEIRSREKGKKRYFLENPQCLQKRFRWCGAAANDVPKALMTRERKMTFFLLKEDLIC